MSIYKDKSGRTHVAIMACGKRLHRRMPKGASASDAKLVEGELRRAAGRRDVHIPSDPQMAEVMGVYLAHADTLRSPETAKYHAIRAGQGLIGRRASEAHICIQKMISDMAGHYKPATVNRSIGAVKKALSIAFMRGMTDFDYSQKIKRIPENNARHEYLAVAQVKRLADAASEQVRAAIWIALLTGCRRGEILKLTKDDIGNDTLRIHAGNPKTLRERHVPIVSALRPWLSYIPMKINAEGLKSGFVRARETVGLPHIHFHDLRHSTASMLINMDVPLEVIRDILGHSSVKTTERYSHLIVARQRKALNKLSRVANLAQSVANQ